MNLGFVNPEDKHAVRRAFQTLQDKLGFGSASIFSGLTLTGLTASRLIASNASKVLTSTDLNSWVTGTTNEINITDDGDGTITIGIVDPLIVGKGGTGAATLTDHGILLGSGTGAITPLAGATNGQLPIGSTGADPVLTTLTGTTNQITVTNGAGTITLSTPQDIATTSIPTFAGLALGSGNITMTGSIGTTGARVTKGWFTDLECTNAIVGGLIALSASSGVLIKNYSGATVASFGLGGADSLNVGLLGNTVNTGTFTAAKVIVDDAGTYIDKDGSNNMTFTDAVVGTRTLKQLGCPTYKYIKATGQAEGDLHLSDGTNWNISKALIKYIRVVTSSTDWDLYILQNDNGYATDDATIPKLKIADSISGNGNIWLDLPYKDEDASAEVHLYYLDNSGANTATIIIQGYELL